LGGSRITDRDPSPGTPFFQEYRSGRSPGWVRRGLQKGHPDGWSISPDRGAQPGSAEINSDRSPPLRGKNKA